MARDARITRPLVVLFLSLWVIGCGAGGPAQPDAPARQPAGTAPQDPSLAKDGKPDFVFDAPAWYAEWKKDRDAAKKKYDGKIVELSGEVIWVMVPFEGSIAGGNLRSGPGGWVNLKSGQGSPVQCITTDPQPWLTVSEGSKVRIRGRAGKVDAEELVECVIVEASPSPALTATIEQITRDVAADREAATQKYDKKYVHATGEVTEVVKDKDGAVRLKLKGASGVGASALLGVPAAHRAGAIEVGQTIRLFGEVLIPRDPKRGVSLSGCVVTREPAK